MDILKELEIKNSELLKRLREELSGIRGGRPTTRLVENIPVDYYNQRMTIKQLGSISIVLPREIQISVWDSGVVPAIVKAVEGGLSVKANIDNNLIRINLPALSEERREELGKLARKEAEETKIKMRLERDEALKKLKREEEDGKISEDQKFRLKDQIQKAIDKVSTEIEQALASKTREINE